MSDYKFIAPWKPRWTQDYEKYGVDWLADWVCFLEVEYKLMQDDVMGLTDRLAAVEEQLAQLAGDAMGRSNMDFIDGATIKGAVTITLRDVETGEVDIWHGPNAIVDDGLELLHQCLQGIAGASPIAYLALGSGTGSFPGSESAMYDEYYRKAITTMSIATNVATYRVYFTTAQASGIIRELGLTNAAGSGAGVLIGHIQVSPQKLKSSAKEMIVAISHTLSRA